MTHNELDIQTNLSQQETIASIPNQMIFDSVYSFVTKLPYSMDPIHQDYISADLYNFRKFEGSILKLPSSNLEYPSFFLELQAWRDTRKTAYAIQLCYVFQLLLREKINEEILIDSEQLEVWGVNKEYQEQIHNILKTFPEYSKKVQNSKNQEEREYYLNQVYEKIKTSFDRFQPKRDLEMFGYFHQIEYHVLSLEEMRNQTFLSKNKSYSLRKITKNV